MYFGVREKQSVLVAGEHLLFIVFTLRNYTAGGTEKKTSGLPDERPPIYWPEIFVFFWRQEKKGMLSTWKRLKKWLSNNYHKGRCFAFSYWRRKRKWFWEIGKHVFVFMFPIHDKWTTFFFRKSRVRNSYQCTYICAIQLLYTIYRASVEILTNLETK